MMDSLTIPNLLYLYFAATKKSLMPCIKDDRFAVVPPWFAHFLTKAAFESANTLLRCDVRSRRDLCIRGRPRNSETMFGKPFRTPFHQPGLSAAYLPAYSSLHRLCGMELSCYLFHSLHAIGFAVNGRNGQKDKKGIPENWQN